MRLRPDATAVVDRDDRLTYRQLLDRATQVARGLRNAGVGDETLVAMSFERSVRAVVAMLGIVLAGAAYLPLNPAHPRRRIEQLLAAGGVRHALCDPADAEVFDAAGVTALDPDALAAPGGELAPVDGGSRLAYVMYTSGSTGEPKGVMVEHAGVLRLVKDADYVELSADDRMLHAAALEFDASTFEVWGALLNGARLCVVDRSTAVVPSRLAAALRSYGITVCWLTAPLFHQIVDEDPDVIAPVRKLLTGGDVVSPGHVRKARRHHPRLRIYNGYGPTENTTFTTVHRVDRDPDGPIPIGRPIRGTTVLIRDGELYTGGLGLARGYLNQPELTAQRFVVIDGERYYRTGDRVRMDADGLLHFLGRVDNQVKIRGNLVEVDEVTAAVLKVPGVADGYTRAQGEPGDRRLLTWVVAPAATAARVRAALAEALPAFMVPDHVIPVPRLPLNTSGKVDWRALPGPAQAGPPTDDSPTHTRLTGAQRQLARMWADVLGVPPETIGPDDGFFDLGGNSLQLGVLLGRLRTGLSMADLYSARTLAAMADTLALADRSGAPAIPPLAPGQPADLHPQQRAMYAIWRADPASLAYNIPFRLDIRGRLDAQRLHTALNDVVARHDALRMRFVVDGGDVRQIAEPGAEPEFAVAGSAEDVAGFVRPFDPDRPVVPRALLVPLGPDRHALHVDVHHIAFDGVSLREFVRELLDRYDGRPCAAPRTAYAAAAQWYHDRGGPDEDYWVARFAQLPPPLALPTDRPRGPRRAVRGEVTRRELDAGWRARITETARRHRTTDFAVMLAAYHAVLARLTGQPAVVVGTPVSGRTHPDVESLVGMFVSTVCLAVPIAPDATFADLIAQTDAQAREALGHQECTFPRLVERLGAGRDPARNPLFDAFFALQNIDFYEFDTGGLAVSVELVNPGTTRFDLNLQAYQRPDRLVLDLEYAAELFERPSADYVLDQYVAVLAELLADVSAPVLPVAAAASARTCEDFDF